MAVTAEAATSSGRNVITTFGTTDVKDHNNVLALTSDGAIKAIRMWSGTLDVGSLADGAGESHDMDCVGVALGDVVLGVSLGVDVVDMTITADVTAADVVTIRVQNESGAAPNLASTTVRVIVADVT